MKQENTIINARNIYKKLKNNDIKTVDICFYGVIVQIVIMDFYLKSESRFLKESNLSTNLAPHELVSTLQSV